MRDPYATLGDLAAQISALRRGEQRLLELADRYGVETLCAGIEGLLEQTSERARGRVRLVAADGRRGGRLHGRRRRHPRRAADHRGASLDDGDGELHVDLAGSAAQSPGGINVPWASSHAAVYFGVRAFCGSAVPQNDGLTRHVHVHCEEGGLLRPRFPAAVSTRHIAVQRLTDVVVEALGDLLPERAVAASHVSFPTLRHPGDRPALRPASRSSTDILGGGGGARPRRARRCGIDSYTSNCALLPAEIAELEYPWRIERTELVEGSGGAGARRAALGMLRDYTLLADVCYGIYYVEQTDPEFAARGRDGGGAGLPGRQRCSARALAEPAPVTGKGYIHLYRGDVLSLVGAGGGGFGAAPSGDAPAHSATIEEEP